MNWMKGVCVLFVIVNASALISGPSRIGYSIAYAADSVTISTAQADSLVTLIDDQRLQLRLLEIDLAEERARNPAEKHGWLWQAVRHPILWFTVGAAVGVSLR